MPRILITSGPTREYLDPVRYLSNASSGRMGCALAEAALAAAFEVTIVSGPVQVDYPIAAEIVRVTSTAEMAAACRAALPGCAGLIAAAAPCDFRPAAVAAHKIRKTGAGLGLELVETVDVIASLADVRRGQWFVAFALETEDRRRRALQKLQRKDCELIIVNSPAAIDAAETRVEMLDRAGAVVAECFGAKREVATRLLDVITSRYALSEKR